MYTCLHCHREFKRKIYFDKHAIACEFLSKSNKERELEIEELSDTPSTRDLYKIIMALAAKCNRMESQLNDIAKCTNIKKQKLDIINWLNENKKGNNNGLSRMSFNDLLNTIVITQDDLNVLFKTDYTGGVLHVLKKYLNLDNNINDISPLYAFTTKENVIYIFMEKEWILCNNEYYNKLMHLLDKKFMGVFIDWQNENKHKGSSDDFALLYTNNMRKIMGGAFTREQLYSRIKREIYNYICSDPPNILEYEISY